MMGFWTAAVIIAAIWGFVTIWSRRHDRELGVIRDEDGNPVFAPQPRADANASTELTELRQRVAVLERIVTDSNSRDAGETARLAAEIDRLREPGLPVRQLSEPAD
jgi:hypothetical protein